jgi:nitrite reductase (NADH) small subunit
MSGWRALARFDDLPEGGVVGFVVDGRYVALCREGDRVFAVEDACPHRGAPFSELGRVRDGRLICGWHFWQFELGTGRHCDLDGVALVRFAVRVVDGVVEVDPEVPA